jgi:polar amino acid transport system substrate-binding protein
MRYNKLIIIGILSMVMALGVSLSASAQTLERIQNSGTINVGFVPDEAPFSFKSGDGQAAGYSVELCQRVADTVKARTGLSGLKVKYIPNSLEASLEMVANGQIDILCGAATETLKRREQVSFSIPIFSSGTGALLRTDATPALVRVLNGEEAHIGPKWRATVNRGLARHTYAVHAGTVTEEWVRDKIKTLGVIASVVTVEDHAKGVDMVARKEADVYFADRALLVNYASQHKDADDLMLLDRQFTYEPIALVTARNDDDFRLVVDTTLSKLYRSGEIAEIYKRYFGEPGDMTLLLLEIYARD